MGVNGISKADIFDEYFDDDKPKITNFEKIKAMDIDEMAEFYADSNCELCIYNPKIYDGSCITEDRDCKVGIKQWLESEVRE